jgi:N-acetyl-gamma-glutamyl-phosphate reductase
MRKLRVGIVGASGYSGSVAARLVATHERLALAFATSDKLAGENVAAHLATRLHDPQLRFVPNAAALDQMDGCEAVVLATAADVSMRLLPAFAERGKQVVDLSGAFRLDAQSYPRWYGFEHLAPAWLERAHYGLPELFGNPPAGAIVANPGCYPTAALLALAPLLRERLIEPHGIVVDAKSGVTGAGRQNGEAYSFAEVDNDLRAYKLFTHQHTPEIARGILRLTPAGTLSGVDRAAAGAADARSSSDVQLTFVAHLLPIKRGLIATCYGRPRAGASAKRVAECMADAYGLTAFVRAVPPDQVTLKGVVGTNFAHVGATADAHMVVAIGAIDNLLKGAAGQAIQNLNAMNGWHETTGLDHLQRVSP